jgi:hypothetical protein
MPAGLTEGSFSVSRQGAVNIVIILIPIAYQYSISIAEIK